VFSLMPLHWGQVNANIQITVDNLEPTGVFNKLEGSSDLSGLPSAGKIGSSVASGSGKLISGSGGTKICR